MEELIASEPALGDDTNSLNSLRLSNIATFLRVILDPDTAGDLFAYTDTASQGSGNPLEHHVRQRNNVLELAWKRFWEAVVPPALQNSNESLTVWLELATQVRNNLDMTDSDRCDVSAPFYRFDLCRGF